MRVIPDTFVTFFYFSPKERTYFRRTLNAFIIFYMKQDRTGRGMGTTSGKGTQKRKINMIQKYRISLVKAVIAVMLTAGLAGQSLAATNKTQLSSKRLRSMARIYMTNGNYEKARGLAEKAYSVARTKSDTNETAMCMIDLGTVYSNLNMLSDADRLLRSGVNLQKQALFDKHPYVAHTYRMLSDVQRRAGNLDVAEQSLSQAVEIMLDNCSLQSNEMSPFILESAKLYSAKGQFQLAQENYEKALDMIRQTYGSQHLMTANVLESMAKCSYIQHDYDTADQYITSSMAIQSKLFGRYNPMLVDGWLTKARICRAKGQADRAEYFLSKATASVEKSRNAMTLAHVYEQVNQIRNEKLYAAAVNLN